MNNRWGCWSAYDYTAAGITGVNASILDVINAAINTATSTGANTSLEIQELVTQASSVISLSSMTSGIGGFLINGITADHNSGYSVSSAGDVNGEGFDDVIIGAPNTDPNSNSASGSSYVVFGKAGTTTVNLVDVAGSAAGSGGFVINGVVNSYMSGRSVSGAGDINGDGLADLLVGAYQNDEGGTYRGSSYVVFGKTGTTALELSSIDGTSNEGFAINGVANRDKSGTSVSAAGNINGDVLDDLLVVAPLRNANGLDSGASYVVFGKASAAVIDLSSLGSSGFAINGVSASDYNGHSVSGAGDVNGDGFSDLIIGAPNVDINGVLNVGASYLVFGVYSSDASVGTNASETLTGSSSANQIIGGAGNNVLLGNGGADVLRGGSGNDVMSIVDANFAKIVGGLGSDTLRFDANFNLSSLANTRIDSVETIDMNNQGVTLSLSDVLSMVGSEAINDLHLIGGKNDTANIAAINFTDSNVDLTLSGVNYNVYTDVSSNTGVHLLIDQDLTVI